MGAAQAPFCQSCGMPMVAAAHFGTNGDHSPNPDYCCFCYRDGAFTNNRTLDEQIAKNLSFYNENEYTDGCKYSLNEVEAHLKTLLPTLKRWSSHTYTHLEYYKSVNRVMEYIHEHLGENIKLDDLAKTANLSSFHFHRIFKAIICESPGDYIQRLRLEKAAFKLQSTALPLADIAEQTGYQSLHALSKAFKKRYGITPSEFRKQAVTDILLSPKPAEHLPVEPEIRKIAPQEVIYLQVTDPLKRENAYTEAWNKLIRFAGTDGIPDEKHEYICLSRDMPTITSPTHYRTYVCLNNTPKIKPKGKFGLQKIDGGQYAVFKHTGAYKNLEDVYCNIYRYWVPNSPYTLRNSTSFEKFLNSPARVKEEELITEIYIPVD